MTRRPIAAGTFYPSDAVELEKLIKNLLANAASEKEKNFGIIAPHAGYVYSAQTAAFSFKLLEKSETYIILGTNHHTTGANICLDDYQTPFGTVKNDRDFSKALLDSKLLNLDSQIHEHSIEVQLPFLQYIMHNNDYKIVPITISHADQKCGEIASAIAEISEKLKRKISIICSSDFIHYGPSYGYVPFEPNIKKIEDLDRKAISFIQKLETGKFLKFAEDKTICGSSAIAVSIELCKILGAKKAKLLKYSTSSDISDDTGNVVGYAGMVFI